LRGGGEADGVKIRMQAEGKNAVLEALKSDVTVDALLVEKGKDHQLIALARQKGVKIQFVDKGALDRISVTKSHQGFIAKTSEFTYCELEDIIDGAKAENGSVFVVILDGVEDPHNLGSIIRVCECGGVSGIVIGKHRSAAVNETVIRVSAGAAEHVRIARVANVNHAIETLKKRGVWVYCADTDGESVYKTDLNGNIALVIGSEGFGVKRLTKELCDKVVALPIKGKVNSLNAATACGILVYEAVRQRSER